MSTEPMAERVAEQLAHVCSLYCDDAAGIHADVLWSNEADLEAMRSWMRYHYGETLVSLDACEAPPADVVIADDPDALFAEINGREANLPASAYRYAYLFRYYAERVS